MENTDHLQALGEETLYMEAIYLSLKIEKALQGVDFTRNQLLIEAERLWKEIDSEYHTFLHFLQDKRKSAA